jgi:hypothetical protein
MIGLVSCLLLAALASAGAPDQAEVQGLYQGQRTGADGKRALEVRVVALGDGNYKALVREKPDGGKVNKVKLDGKTQGGQVVFSGKADGAEWAAQYADGEIQGTVGDDGKLGLQRVHKKPPTLGKKPPEGAIVLLDGESWDQMVRRGGAHWYVDEMSKDGWAVWEVPIRTIVARQPDVWPTEDNVVPEDWKLTKDRRRVDEVIGIGEDGSIRVPRGGMNSKQQFEGSFDLHVEFNCPLRAKSQGQGRGNSGVYLPNRTEIQVLDSFGMTTYEGGGCGGLYRWKNPDAFDEFSLASLPPLQWQTYDVEYRVRRNDEGKVVGKPTITVYHNGIKIHDQVELRKDARKGSFHFQDHGNPVRYRNIWYRPLTDYDEA